jgi:hypothetical protein
MLHTSEIIQFPCEYNVAEGQIAVFNVEGAQDFDNVDTGQQQAANKMQALPTVRIMRKSFNPNTVLYELAVAGLGPIGIKVETREAAGAGSVFLHLLQPFQDMTLFADVPDGMTVTRALQNHSGSTWRRLEGNCGI